MLSSQKMIDLVNHFMEVILDETGFPVLIYDTDGRIVHATDKGRIGDLHAGAERIMQSQANEYAVTAQEAARNPFVREGYSCPIVVDGEIIAGFGITGKIEIAKPLARTAAKMIDAWIEKVRYQEQLERSEEKYFKAFNNSPVWVVLSSLETGRHIEVNEAYLSTLGYSRDEIIGRTSIEIGSWVNPEDRSAILKMINEQGAVKDYEVLRRTKSGVELTMLFSAERIEVFDEPCIIAVYQDITDRKRAEEEADKFQKALVQSQKMEAIGTLASGIAHDFNNILSAVIGYTEIALGDGALEDVPVRGYLENVLKAGLRAKDLVKQILAFSRQAQYEKKPILLEPLVKEVLQLIRASLPTNIEIRQKINANNSMILADPIQIHQVLMNLCSNAGYAMRQKGGLLEVLLAADCTMEDPNQPTDEKLAACVTLSVKDTGTGMHPVELERIFNPFYTTKPKEEGTGMGLSVVHGIVTDHGGTIAVESREGEGTTFTVSLPLLPVFERTDHLGAPPLPMGNESILLVDDEQAVADSTEKILERLGYRVSSFTNSKEAFKVFSKDPRKFDLVLTDQTMPELTGVQLAKKLLALRPDIPIVLCTGFSHVIGESEAKKMGLRDLIMKPVVQKKLAATVRRVLDQK